MKLYNNPSASGASTLARYIALFVAPLFLNACAVTSPAPIISSSTLPTSAAHASQVSELSAAAMEQFVDCKKEGLALDESARKQKSPAQYAASARTLDLCLVEVDEYRDAVPMELRMQVHALTVLNYVKGGDIAKARLQLRAFELSYPNRDLYFSDYTSFIDSLNAVLGRPHSNGTSSQRVFQQRTSNINPMVSTEISRYRYWKMH